MYVIGNWVYITLLRILKTSPTYITFKRIIPMAQTNAIAQIQNPTDVVSLVEYTNFHKASLDEMGNVVRKINDALWASSFSAHKRVSPDIFGNFYGVKKKVKPHRPQHSATESYYKNGRDCRRVFSGIINPPDENPESLFNTNYRSALVWVRRRSLMHPEEALAFEADSVAQSLSFFNITLAQYHAQPSVSLGTMINTLQVYRNKGIAKPHHENARRILLTNYAALWSPDEEPILVLPRYLPEKQFLEPTDVVRLPSALVEAIMDAPCEP